MQSKNAIGNLISRYKAVLKKCNLMNTFGSLAIAGMLVLGGVGMASATALDGVESVSDSSGTAHYFFGAAGDSGHGGKGGAASSDSSAGTDGNVGTNGAGGAGVTNPSSAETSAAGTIGGQDSNANANPTIETPNTDHGEHGTATTSHAYSATTVVHLGGTGGEGGDGGNGGGGEGGGGAQATDGSTTTSTTTTTTATGTQGKHGAAGNHGSGGEAGEAGGNGTDEARKVSTTVEGLVIGGAGGAGGHGGVGGSGGDAGADATGHNHTWDPGNTEDTVSSTTTWQGGNGGVGGNGGHGASGGAGGVGKMTFGNTDISNITLTVGTAGIVLGGDGGDAGDGNSSGIAGTTPTATSTAGGGAVTSTVASTGAGGAGGAGDSAATGGGDGASGVANAAGAAGAGGNGGNGGNGGDGTFTFKNGNIYNEGNMELGGDGGDGGDGGKNDTSATGTAGNGGKAGKGGNATVTFELGSGKIATDILLGGKGGAEGAAGTTTVASGTAGTKGAANVGGDGTLEIKGGAFYAEDMTIGGVGGVSGGATVAKGGDGKYTQTGGTMIFTGTVNLGNVKGTAAGGAIAGDAGNALLEVKKGTVTMKSFTVETATKAGGATRELEVFNGTATNDSAELAKMIVGITTHTTSKNPYDNNAGNDGLNNLRNEEAINWVMTQEKDATSDDSSAKKALTGAFVLLNDATVDLTDVTEFGVGEDATATGKFDAGSLMLIDAKEQAGRATHDTVAAIKLDNYTIEDGASIMMIADEGLTKTDTFVLATNNGTSAITAWAKAGSNGTTSRLVTLEQVTTAAQNTAKFTASDATKTMHGINGSTAQHLANMFNEKGVDTFITRDAKPEEAGIRFVSRATDLRFVATGEESAVIVGNSLKLANVAGVQTGAIAVADQAHDAVQNHTAALISAADGVSAGDDVKFGLGVWASPLYGNESRTDIDAGAADVDVDSEMYGLAFGLDYRVCSAFLMGVAVHAGESDTDSDSKFFHADNEAEFYGADVYARTQFGNFGVSLDGSYTKAENEVTQELPMGMALRDLKADIDSTTISAALQADYRIATGIVNILPHVGVEYTHITTDDYTVESNGETAIKTKESTMEYFAFPVGISFDKKFEFASGWYVAPTLDLGAIFAVGDLDSSLESQIVGVSGHASQTTDLVDEVTGSGSFGIKFGGDNLSFGLGYNGQYSENRISHGVNATVRFEF